MYLLMDLNQVSVAKKPRPKSEVCSAQQFLTHDYESAYTIFCDLIREHVIDD